MIAFPGKRLSSYRFLQELDRICRANQIRSVATIAFGFEDEAEALSDWRPKPGLPTHLTIHLEAEGDAAALEMCADAVEL